MSIWIRGTILVVTVLVIVTNPTLALAQASVEAFAQQSQEAKFFYIAGYLDGFALAADQTLQDRAARLQKCFADFGTAKSLSLFEAWITRSPGQTQLPARTGVFSALAEACGWKRP
jgi:hypothetical protein